MKKLILILVVVVILGCNLYPEDTTFKEDAILSAMDLTRESTELDVIIAISEIEYLDDIEQYGLVEYWASVEQTVMSKKGDCEDIAILTAYLFNVLFDVEMDFAILKHLEDKDFHMVAVYNDKYVGYDLYVRYRNSFNEYLEISNNEVCIDFKLLINISFNSMFKR